MDRTPKIEVEDLNKKVDRLVQYRSPYQKGYAPDLIRLRAAIDVANELWQLADDLVARHVEAARDAGNPWSRIGNELGVTRQGAHKRYSSSS